MKKKLAFNMALTLSMFGSTTLPALAQQAQYFGEPAALQASIIPQSAAIAVVFPNDVELELGKEQNYPMTLFLAQPLADHSGNIIAPANSLVSAHLKLSDEGAQIVVNSIVVGGRVVPLEASSAMIPGIKVAERRGSEQAKESGGIGRAIGTAIGGVAGLDSRTRQQIGFGGALVGVIAGLNSPEEVLVVRIRRGTPYILTLQAPVVIRETSVQVQPANIVQY